MARPPKTIEVMDLNDESIDQPKVAAAMALMQADAASSALAQAQHHSAVRAVAERVGYQLESSDPDLIQRDIAAHMRRSVEACLEVGRGLCVLKTACAHGEFMARLEVLGIDHTVAKRFMQAAHKFSNGASTHHLKAIGNQTKLFELLILDDEQIEELMLTGQSGELRLDDVASMSVKELRRALREERLERAADARLLQNKALRIERLEREAIRIETLPANAELEQTMKEATAIARDCMGAIRGGLRQALLKLNDCPGGGDTAVFMAGLVGQVQADLNALRYEYNLPDVSNAAEAALAAEVAQWAG